MIHLLSLPICNHSLIERRVQIAAVNDPPRVRLPGQVFRRPRSVVWPETEDLEVVKTDPLLLDEDSVLDVPGVSISGTRFAPLSLSHITTTSIFRSVA